MDRVRKDYRSQMASSPIVAVKLMLTAAHRRCSWRLHLPLNLEAKAQKSLRCWSGSQTCEFLLNPTTPTSFIRIIKAMHQYWTVLFSFFFFLSCGVVICRVISAENPQLKGNKRVGNDLDVAVKDQEGAEPVSKVSMLTRTQTMDPVGPDAA